MLRHVEQTSCAEVKISIAPSFQRIDAVTSRGSSTQFRYGSCGGESESMADELRLEGELPAMRCHLGSEVWRERFRPGSGGGRGGYLGRLFSSPGPALLPEDEFADDERRTAFPEMIKLAKLRSMGKLFRLLSAGTTSRVLSLINPLNNLIVGAVSAKKCEWRSKAWKIACDNGAIRIRKNDFAQCSGEAANGITSAAFIWSFGGQWDTYFKYSLQVCLCETGGSSLLAADSEGDTVPCCRTSTSRISSVEERDEFVNNLLFKLGLVSCADSIVGDAKVRGISGGEKKRLSLACELIASPSVIFADEPTTEGALVYAGPAHDEPLAYFTKFGYRCSDHVNPAEFLADLISVDYSSAESVYSSRKRIDGLVESFSEQLSTVLYATPFASRESPKNGKKLSKKTVVKRKETWWRQFWLLLKRAWMQASRDGPTNKVRARMSIRVSYNIWISFLENGKISDIIQDRMGLLQVAAINTAMAALTKTVGVFPKERAIVDRERAKGSYALGPYLLSKLIAEIPVGAAFPLMFGAVLYPMARLHPTLSRFGKFCGIVTAESFAASAMGLTVGAMAPTTEAAMALGPSLMTVFIVFGGYYVNADNTPIIFRWIPNVSLIRCGLKFDHQHSFDIETGEQALERLSFGGSHINDTVIAQSRILLFWYCTTYLILQKNKPKYQQLESLPLEQIQPQLQLEPVEPDKVKQLNPPMKQVELNQQLESPALDQIRPFILEGAK
ncbi:hypothetical protein GH714_041162 [Hevea brasiliensis]|uniref:ABC transporter domain-containing protein n=1 Tax=Hevea brasiliensis TaxID=3981 RepID=A0A6A6MZX8_HEVBR|nr:hypothetical protein GH714_041162 [Hevea brasiliensis]